MDKNLSYNDILLKYAEYQEKARKILKPSCHVCKICNGVACAGRFTNSLEFGSKGTNAGFRNSTEALNKIRIQLDVIHDDFEPDTAVSLFGHSFELPVFAAPIAKILTDYTFESRFFNNNGQYAEELIIGAYEAGGMAWLGDNISEGYFPAQVNPLRKVNGIGVPTIKPWADRQEYWDRVALCKDIGVMAIATDLDSIGLGYQYSGKGGVKPRSVEELKEIVKALDVPFIVKGVMSVRTAAKALEAGAYGILVSNHGGNVVEHSLSPSDVLPAIKDAVGGSMKVFADGSVRSGEDVFKLLALGADAVGIGRPYVVSVYGGEREGAFIYTRKILCELKNIMRLANCRSLSDITRDHVVIKP